MKHIFLIANNPKINKNIFRYLRKIRRWRKYRGSLIVAFNHMDHLSRIQPNIIMVRGNKWQNYMGMRRDTGKHIKSHRIKGKPKYIFIDHPSNFRRFKKYNANSIMIRGRGMVRRYTRNKTPTSGFIAIFYFLRKYRKKKVKVHLVGFTFKKKWRGHNYHYEKIVVSRLLKKYKNLDIINSLQQLKQI